MFKTITDRAYAMTIKYGGSIELANEWIVSINNNNHPTGGTLDDKMVQIRCNDKERLVKRLYNFYVKQLIIDSTFESCLRNDHIMKYRRRSSEYFDRTGQPYQQFSVYHGMPKPNIDRYKADLYMEEYKDISVFT